MFSTFAVENCVENALRSGASLHRTGAGDKTASFWTSAENILNSMSYNHDRLVLGKAIDLSQYNSGAPFLHHGCA
jgi:hypothetical protein